MKPKTSRAFSLVELSIIILIVGIVIAGVTEGSRLLKQMRLSTARNLTASSDIRSIENMILWLDATSETSLTTDSSALVTAKNTDETIYNWDDQNPQVLTSVKPRFSQSGASSIRPVYKEIGINNIPTLYFDASSNAMSGDVLYKSFSSTLNPETFTLFVVTRPMENTTANNAFIIENATTTTGFSFKLVTSGETLTIVGYDGTTTSVSSNDAAVNYNAPYISTISTNGTVQTIYRNGTAQDSDSIVEVPNTSSANFLIGCASTAGNANCFDGYISEIIMFDRVLSTEERNSVTKYLGKKYAILVAA
jgi:type II secretory pathway pseudopilin PulG